jgi:hypothetical protein
MGRVVRGKFDSDEFSELPQGLEWVYFGGILANKPWPVSIGLYDEERFAVQLTVYSPENNTPQNFLAAQGDALPYLLNAVSYGFLSTGNLETLDWIVSRADECERGDTVMRLMGTAFASKVDLAHAAISIRDALQPHVKSMSIYDQKFPGSPSSSICSAAYARKKLPFEL